jgi:DNA polymerase-3 subunit alpha
MLGQQSIFGEKTDEEADEKEWTCEERLKHEKEALGFYITGHPLTKYEKILKRIGVHSILDLENITEGQAVMIAGILSNIRKIQTKSKSELMAYGILEDAHGNIEFIVFPDLYKNHQQLLQKDTPLIIKGTLERTEKGMKVVTTEITGLDEFEKQIQYKVEINLQKSLSDAAKLQRLKSVITSQRQGRYPLYLRICSQNAEALIATGMKISPDREIISLIEEIAGKGTVAVQ